MYTKLHDLSSPRELIALEWIAPSNAVDCLEVVPSAMIEPKAAHRGSPATKATEVTNR